jgi:hypothetical protein
MQAAKQDHSGQHARSLATPVHVVMADRRDAVVDLDTLAVTSRTLRASDIADALVWIEANRAHCIKFFKECNP